MGQLGWLRRTTGCHFWQEFSNCVYVMCLSEIKYALMAQSVVGVPGVMTLLCNLSTTVNLETDAGEVEKVRALHRPQIMDRQCFHWHCAIFVPMLGVVLAFYSARPSLCVASSMHNA